MKSDIFRKLLVPSQFKPDIDFKVGQTRRRRHRKWATILGTALVLLLLTATLALASHNKPAWLTQEYAGSTYKVYYATSCPASEPTCTADELVPTTDSNSNGTPDAVESMSGYLEGSRTAFVTTFSMREPYFNSAPDRPAYLSGGCWGSYNGHNMWMCAKGTSLDWVQSKATALHELFHGTQFAYSIAGSQPGWVIEGQAAFMEDQVFSDLDDNAGTFLFSQGQAYLGDPNGFAITRIGYEAAWFWKYFAEKFGTSPDPGQGMDAVKRFWDKSESDSVSGITAFNRTLSDLGSSMTFEEVYKDFVIANYARKLTDPSVPSKYRFSDESEPQPGPLRAVKLDVDQTLGASDQVGPLTSDVNAWGVRYYSVSPSASVPIISVNVHQDTSNRLFYTLLAVKNNRIALEERYVGRNYSRSLTNAAYDRVVLIVAGLDNYANYRLGINATQPTLNIVDPLQSRPAQVAAGTPAIRSNFLVKVEVLDNAAQPVTGIVPTTFTVTVGTSIVPSGDIVTSAYLQGQYWLLVRAPSLPAGQYDLSVEWSSLSDQETRALNYATLTTSDNIVVVDRSGSMNDFNKMAAAKNAARLYIDSWPDGDKLGVASFSNDATINHSLQTLNSTTRTNAHSSVNALAAGGGTSVGDGADTAMTELINNGSATDGWVIVLLSDGMETSPQSISDFMTTYNTRKKATPPQKVPVIHTVALGPDADRAKLQDLARKTGGTYHYAAEAAPFNRLTAPNINLPLDLAELYRIVAEAIDTEQQIFSEQVFMVNEQDVVGVEIQVDAQAAEGIFTVNWPDLYSSGTTKLIDPDGVEYTGTAFYDSTHVLWRVPNPKEGIWVVNVDCSGIEFCASDYLIEAALKSPLMIDLHFNPDPVDRKRGLPLDVVVSLTDQQPVLGAEVVAYITAPNNLTIYTLPLYDDGAHHDGGPNDGLYGNRFYSTFQEGSYIVRANASGISNLGSPFVRSIKRAFDIAPDGDDDDDGLPNGWEEENGTDPKQDDADKDPDQDGCLTIEEYWDGTNPQDADTDDGGENDCSEKKYAHDPHDPQDDGVTKSPGELYVIPGKGFNLLLLPLAPEIPFWNLYAATDLQQGFSWVDTIPYPTHVYSHTGLVNGTTYWYLLVGSGAGGHATAPTDPVAATPQEDPLSPGGSVLINDGAQETHSTEVVLSLQAFNDAGPSTPNDLVATLFEDSLSTSTEGLEMRISNDSSFEGANWEPFNQTRPWTLGVTNGPAIVYVQVRDPAGNLSDTFSDAITVITKRYLFLPLLFR